MPPRSGTAGALHQPNTAVLVTSLEGWCSTTSLERWCSSPAWNVGARHQLGTLVLATSLERWCSPPARKVGAEHPLFGHGAPTFCTGPHQLSHQLAGSEVPFRHPEVPSRGGSWCGGRARVGGSVGKLFESPSGKTKPARRSVRARGASFRLVLLSGFWPGAV